MNPESHNPAPGDDELRLAFRTLVATAPPAPTFDEMTDIAARNGIRTPEWATDRYALPDASVAARRPRRRVGGIVMAWLLAVGLIGGGGYAAYAGFVGPDGYDSPTAATRGFLGALEEGNLLKASRALVPWERDGLDGDLRAAVQHAQSDGLLATNDLGAAKNISLTEHGLELAEVPLANGITRVEAGQGTLELHLDPGLFADSPGAPTDLPKTIDLVRLLTPRIGEEDRGRPGLVAVQSDGDWYVSLSYTIADHQRVALGKAVPDLTSTLQPIGADSPEAAATTAMSLLYGSGDIREVTPVLDPVSGQALLRYGPIFLDPTNPGAPVTTPATEWAVEGSGDTRTVKLTKLTAAASGDQPEQAYTSDHRCVTEPGTCTDIAGSFLFDRGITVVKHDGRWFINPIGSAVNLFSDLVVGRSFGMLNDGRSQSASGGSADLAALDGTPELPPEAHNDPANGWSLSFESNKAPSSQVLALVDACVALPHLGDTTAQDGPGTLFPDGFFDCIGQRFGGWSLADGPGVILPNSVPVNSIAAAATSTPSPTTTP